MSLCLHFFFAFFDLALPSRDQRGPLCYNCPYMRDPTSCNRVTVCGRDQVRKLLVLSCSREICFIIKLYEYNSHNSSILQRKLSWVLFHVKWSVWENYNITKMLGRFGIAVKPQYDWSIVRCLLRTRTNSIISKTYSMLGSMGQA